MIPDPSKRRAVHDLETLADERLAKELAFEHNMQSMGAMTALLEHRTGKQIPEVAEDEE